MQRKRSASNAFPEPIDLNRTSFANNTSMDNSPSEDNPLRNYIVVSSDEDVSSRNDANNSTQRLDHGEASSNANNLQDGDDSRMTVGWSSSSMASSGPDARSVDWSFQPSNVNSSSYLGNQVSGVQNYVLNHGSLNVTSNHGNIGTSSGTLFENNDASDPSFGSSSKRKALEGTSRQFYPGGSSSSNQPMGKNIIQDPLPYSYAPPGNLSISSGPLNMAPTNHSEQLSLSNGVGMNRAARPFYPSSRVPIIAENSARNFTVRSNPMRNFGELRPVSNTDSSDLRAQLALPTNPTNTVSQSHTMHVNEARVTNSYAWNGSLGSRGRSSSNSFMISRERGSEDNVRSSRRNNPEYPMTVSEDQIDWGFSGSRAGPSSGWRAGPQQNETLQTHQRLLESDHGTRRRNFALVASPSSSSDEVANTSGAHNHSDQTSAAFLIQMADDVIGRRSLADLEDRHRVIRQVLNAMRRGVRLRDEDYVLIDPLIDGIAELHDRHRDMRLDVDNMSYEELLALGEQIGEVSTGLSEEKIKGSMKQRKYEAIQGSPNLEPCCICREDYIAGDDIGVLDCGHEFHASCVQQWLILKNLCPICKTTALKLKDKQHSS